MRRHWQLACCAFSFCWYSQGHAPATEPRTAPVQSPPSAKPELEELPGEQRDEGKKGTRSVRTTARVLAQSEMLGQSLARTLGLAQAILAGVVDTAPTPPAPAAP
jgi:hypothetical protein